MLLIISSVDEEKMSSSRSDNGSVDIKINLAGMSGIMHLDSFSLRLEDVSFPKRI